MATTSLGLHGGVRRVPYFLQEEVTPPSPVVATGTARRYFMGHVMAKRR